ncbi:MAG: heavy-metal-associated domain-containing protein [Deltaproteobacteria bacterium]|nr:heavy-metal-associated domain-containing protein [Deltaproteobacteria bacterium]
MKKFVFSVEGMSCKHCEKRIENALKEVKNVISSKANFQNHVVEILAEGELDISQIKHVIEAEGYRFKGQIL